MMLPPSPDKDGISSAVALVAPGHRTLKKRWRRRDNRRAPVMLPPSTDEDGISTAAAAVEPRYVLLGCDRVDGTRMETTTVTPH